MIIDIDPPALNTLTIDGDLKFVDNRTETKTTLTANHIWVR
jgi:hypothetical protein